MRKILAYIILLFSLGLSSQTSFADECSQNCQIQDAPAAALEEYIKNNRKVVQNISAELSATDDEMWIKEGVRIYNSFTDWNTFTTGVEFFKLHLVGEVPYPVKRDLQLLEREGEYLNSFLKNAIQSGYTQSIIKNPCSGVPNCTLSGNAGSVIGAVVNNHKNILEFYKLSLLGRESEFQQTILFVNDNFVSELHNHYNKYTLSDCSKCEGEFGKKIKESIQEISLKDKSGKDGIKEWKRAWALLTGSKNIAAEYADLERKLLEEELNKQNISEGNGTAVLKNLDNYNNNGYSSDNNPINNSFSTFKNSIDTTGEKSLVSHFFNSVSQIVGGASDYMFNKKETIPINTLIQVESHVSSSHTIMQEVHALYKREIPFAASQDLNSEKLQARIIQMHIDLSQAINILDKTKPLSEKVCNDQDRGNGKCKY